MATLDQLLEQYDRSQQQMTQRGEGLPPSTAQSVAANVAARVAGTPIDLTSNVGAMLGLNEPPKESATEEIRKGAEEWMGVSSTEKNDVVTNFLIGAGEALPYAVAATGPAVITPVGALTTGLAVTGAGLYNVFVESDFYDENPLSSTVIEGVGFALPMIAGAKTRVARPSDKFDPNLPLTRGETGVGIGDQKEQLAREAQQSRSRLGVESETARSEVFEAKLLRDFNVIEVDPNLTWRQAADEIRTKVMNRSKALARKFNYEQDKKIAAIPDVKVPLKPFSEALTDPKFKNRGALAEPNQVKAIDLYNDRLSTFTSVNPRTLHEEMKLIGEIGWDAVPFDQTGFYKKYANKPETAELVKTLNEMPLKSREAWAKHVYKSYNRGLTNVAKSDVVGGKAAQGLLDFKKLANEQIAIKQRLQNQPLYKFFGEDFATMSATDLAKALDKSNPEAVKVLSASLRKTNPEAFDKLRETVFMDWLKNYKARGADGKMMFDWEMLTDPNELKKLTGNSFLQTGVDGVAFAETLKALKKISRKFDPDIIATETLSPARAEAISRNGLKMFRAGYYDKAVAAEGLLGIVKTVMFSNPKNLALFNPMEQQMMTRVLKGQELSRKSMEKLYDSVNAKSRVLFAVPVTVVGGRSARAAGQEVTPINEQTPEGLDALIIEYDNQQQASQPQAMQEIPFGA